MVAGGPKAPTGGPPEGVVRFRAILIGLALIPPLGFWIFRGEVVQYTFGTWAAPFYTAVFVLFVFTVANLLVNRFVPKLALNRVELFAIYAMVSVASGLIATDMMGILIPLMGHATWFATPENNWAKTFADALPKWLTVTDHHALIGYYNGASSLYRMEHIKAWLAPSLWWIAFTWALVISLLCLSTILRRQWQDRERLTYPIVQLPLAMVSEPSQFFRNRAMWIGFLIAGGVTFINGLAYMYPSIPMIPIKRRSIPFFNSPPWDAIGNQVVAFYFFAIALGFIMPLDVSFSCWFFYILFLIERIVASAIGRASGTLGQTDFPYPTDQAFGAYLAVFVVAIWGLKAHLKEVLRQAWSRRSDEEGDSGEPFSYRFAVIAFILCTAFMLGFAIAGGMSPIVAVGFFAVYLALSIMICRVRCELGFPVHDMHGIGPHGDFTRIFGAASFSHRTLGMFGMFYWFNRVYRSHPMPHDLEAMRLAGGQGRAQRGMAKALLIGAMFAVPVCFWVYLHSFYQMGAGSAKMGIWALGYANEALGNLDGWINRPKAIQSGGNIAMVVGFGIAMALAVLRRRMVGFPFNPLAYAVANSWGMYNLWLPIMIGSLIKAATLKGTGLRGYRKAVFFFYGLMLGEFVVGCCWTLGGMVVGLITHDIVRTYDFWP